MLDPPETIASRRQRARFRHRVSCIVDIAARGEILGNRLDIRWPGVIPPSLPDLAGQVLAQLSTGGGESSNIGKGKPVQFLRAERWSRLPAFVAPHGPFCATLAKHHKDGA